LKELVDLRSLSLVDNEITDISYLKDLVGLTSLELNYNQLTDISYLKDLVGLIFLDLSYNQLTDISSLLSLIKKGREVSIEEFEGDIRLSENPLGTPPIHIIEQGNEAIIRYFEALEKEEVQEVQLLEAKVLLLGEGKTGKTSLRIKIEDETKDLPKEDDRTRGVDIYNYKFPTQNGTFVSHIWDFGGQDVLYQVHRFFLSDDALYILVTDSRFDQGNKYEEWLQTIEIFTQKDDNQIILLQNLMYGDIPANIDIADYVKYYSIVEGKVFEVDLSFSEPVHLNNFRAFKQIIEDCLLVLPHVQKTILSDWLEVRLALEQLLEAGTNVINFSHYVSICEEYKIEEKRQKDLLRYLHRLGIVLWYEDYRAIKQKVILNPEWVTTALYRIIDSKNIRDKNGKLEQKDIEILWSEVIYEDYHNELLQILLIFRLAYSRKHEDAYIVPSLMNTVIPKKYEAWNPEDKWMIRYKYPRLMPRGIVNQLAAELCKYIASDFDDVWAFGVIFTTKKSKAKVQVNRNLKQISVEIDGDERLKLQHDIVKAMEDIHETYKGLEFDIEIPCICNACNELPYAKKTYHKYNEEIMREVNDNRDDIYCRNLRGHVKIAPILRSSGFALPYKLVEMLRAQGQLYQSFETGVLASLQRIEATTHKTFGNTEEIKISLYTFEELLSQEQNANLSKEKIIQAIQETTEAQRKDIYNDMITALDALYTAMDEQQQLYFEDLKSKGDNVAMKIKASVPLLNLVGLDIGMEGEFDIKSWTEQMYEKYKVQLFKLFGYL
jgi:hypothetical protein